MIRIRVLQTLSACAACFSTAVASFAGTASSQTFPAAAVAPTATGLAIEYRVPEAIFASDRSTSDDDPSGVVHLRLPGKPEIPVIARTLLLPADGAVALKNLRVGSSLARQPRSLDDAPPDVGLACDLPVGDDGFWPADAVMLGEPASIRGWRIAVVHLFPVQVNLSTGETRRNESFDFELVCQGGVGELNRPKVSAVAAEFVRSLVDNPPPLSSLRDAEGAGSMVYIVPRANGVDTTLAPLIQWRRKQGFNVRVEHVDLNTPANEIKAILQEAYNADPPLEFATLVGDASGGNFNVAPASNEGDWGYSRLDGNDPLPDIALGRLSARTTQQLRTIVNKIISYESNPNDDDPAWQFQGGVVAGSHENGISEVFAAKYVRRELLSLGFNEVRHWYWNENGDVGGNQEYLTNWFRWGMSVLHYRAFWLMNNLDTRIIYDLPNTNGPWPAVLAISCETGNFTGAADGHSEAFLRSRGGGVGAIGTATPNTNVKYNNLMAGGVWKGVYRVGGSHFGWGLNYGKYELWRAFAGFDANYVSFLDWNNLMGDAATDIWTGEIRRFSVQRNNELPLGSSRYALRVTDSETGEPVADAQVCLYQVDGEQIIGVTDPDGDALLAFPPATFGEGEINLTITKHNHKPWLEDISVGQAESFIGLDSWEIAAGDDGDGFANPGEELTLTFNLRNFGAERPEGELRMHMIPGDPLLDFDNDTIRFDAAPGGGETASADFALRIAGEAADGAAPVAELRVYAGELEWVSSLEIPIAAPLLNVTDLDFPDGEFIPGSTKNISIELGNVGHKALPSFRATISSFDQRIEAVQGGGSYPALAVGEGGWGRGQPFRLSVAGDVIPGSLIPIDILAEPNGAPPLRTTFNINVGRPTVNDPTGPDKFGYLCFDSGDTTWAMAPLFDWIEINPDIPEYDFRGTRLNISDGGDNQDESIAVDLPFDFNYYGEMFGTITVCTNGWAAFGDQSDLADFRNTHIGQALGPKAQLCVWWDNLTTNPQGGVYACYDDEGGRFIIEWSRMRRLLGNNNLGASETFQIILHDQSSMPTSDGIGVITYQYLDVANENRPAHNDIPFCTIGVSDLLDLDGVEYTYYSIYKPGARQIRSGMALRFTTSLSVRTGHIRGRVLNLATGRPIERAIVRSNRRSEAITDRNGIYGLDLVMGSDVLLTAGGFGYNDSTAGPFEIAEDETLTVNFALRHPEVVVSLDSVGADLDLRQRRVFDFTIRNSGDGTLQWGGSRYVEGEESDLGPRRRTLGFARAANDINLLGVAHAGDRFYVSGANGNGPRLIYSFDEQGALVDTFLQPGNSPGPMPDLAWDGQLLWGSGERIVYGFDLNGVVRRSFLGPFQNNKCLAWDSERNLIWVSATGGAFYGLDADGRAFRALPAHGLRASGIAFWPDDPDGYQLYVMHNPGLDSGRVYKIDIENDEVRFVADLTPPERGQPCGIEITPDFLTYDWSLAVLMNDNTNRTGDRGDLYQLGTYTGWLSLEPESGLVAAGSTAQASISLSSDGLEPGEVRGTVTISHNAGADAIIIPVALRVTDLAVEEEAGFGLPESCRFDAVWPSPFNSSFKLKYTLAKPGRVRLSLLDVSGRLFRLLESGERTAGEHHLAVQGDKIPSGVYFLRLEAEGVIRTARIVAMK